MVSNGSADQRTIGIRLSDIKFCWDELSCPTVQCTYLLHTTGSDEESLILQPPTWTMNPFFGDSRRQQPYITFRRTPTYILVHNYMKSTLRNLRQVGAHLYDVVRSQDCRVAVSCNLLVVACFFVLLLVLLFFFFFSGDLRKCRLWEFVAGSSPLLFTFSWDAWYFRLSGLSVNGG